MANNKPSPVISSIIILFLLIGLNVYSQPNKRTNFWYFADSVGLEFNSGVPVEDTSGVIFDQFWGGTSVMCDTNGNLLFYSNGKRVWNKNHQVMTNGYGGSSFYTGTQAALCVPKPGSDSIFYIFTARLFQSENPMFYYVINMAGNNGLGEVIDKDTLLAGWDAAEKLTAAYHKNKEDIWILTRKLLEHKYAAFLVNSEGVVDEPILSPAPERPGVLYDNNKGYMKVSYDKKYLLSCFKGTGASHTSVEICKFNIETGSVDFLFSFILRDIIPGNPYYNTYNCDFSPCSKYMYLSGELPLDSISHIFQFDMQYIEDSILFKQSAIKIGEPQGTNIQLASDGKIYCFARSAGYSSQWNNYVGIIHNPGKYGFACNYQENAFILNHGRVGRSLVNFATDFLFRFDFDGICESDTFLFDPWFFPEPTYIEWNFGDILSGANNTSTIPHATHKFTDGGTYEVSVYVEYPSGRIEETSRKVEVEYAPEPDLGPDTTICTNTDIILDAECGPHFYTWSTGAIGSSQITVSDTGWYWVRVENDVGCFGIDSIHIGLFPPAIADTTNLEIIPTTCGGSTGVIKGLIINGLPPITYLWIDDLGNPISYSLDIYHLPVGNYTLEVTDSNNCVTSFGPYSIIDAGDVLIENVDYTQEHCDQQDASITITAVSGLGDMLFYSIDNGANYYSNLGIFTALSAGSYAVRVRDSSDCQSVYINNPVIIQNIDAPEIIDVQVGASSVGQSTGSIEITAFGGSDTLFYSNDNGANFQINDGGFYNLAAGFYTCVVVDEIGCDTTFIVEVPEEVTIRLQAVAGEDEACPGNAAYVPLFVSNFNDVAYFKTTLLYNKDFLTCTGFANAHVLLEDSLQALLFPTEGKIELLWSSDAVDLPDNTPIADLVFQTIDPGLSLVEWDGSAGASLFQNSTGLTIPVDYFTGNVKIYQEVSILLSSSEEVCRGESLEIDPWILSSNGDVSYLWTYPNGDTSDSETLSFYNIQEGQSGTYSVIVSDTLDCQSEASVDVIVPEASVDVIVHPLPIPDFAGQDTIITEEPVEIDAGPNYVTYLWNTGESTQWITASYDGWYGVIIESQQGCMGEDSVYVLFFIPPEPPEPPEPIIENFYVPNAFSPDGDGLNDEFKAISNTENISSFHMYIYNRWGELVFEANDVSLGWDGEYKGKPAPQGVYVYKIEYFIGTSPQEECRIISGTVMLVR
jgi:gliding motility-associated-like protein